MPLSYDDYERRRMMGYNPFDSYGIGRDPIIEIKEPDEGRITVEIQDMNTGRRYCKEFILSYNHNKGRKAFIPSPFDVEPTYGLAKKMLMLFL